MKLHPNYLKALKDYYKDHQKLPKDYDKGFFGRSTTETLIFSLPEDAVWIDDEYDENYDEESGSGLGLQPRNSSSRRKTWDEEHVIKRKFSALIPAFDPRPGRTNINQTSDLDIGKSSF
mgnify:CR=1 FL=1